VRKHKKVNEIEGNSGDPISGSPYSSITSHTKRQDFGLEALGNWKEFKEDGGYGSEIR
jgi:hypothetical protein